MLICNPRNECFSGNKDLCIKIDDASMGFPFHDFGVLMQAYCGHEINGPFIEKITRWFALLESNTCINQDELFGWLNSHKGELLDSECW